MIDQISAELAQQPRQVCTIPDCDGAWHHDNTCVTEVAELTFDAETALPIELVQEAGAAPHVLAFGFDMTAAGLRREMHTAASVREFAAQLRIAAEALDRVAGSLPASI